MLMQLFAHIQAQECEKLCSHCGDCIDQPLGLYVAVAKGPVSQKSEEAGCSASIRYSSQGMLTSIVELACCVVACKESRQKKLWSWEREKRTSVNARTTSVNACYLKASHGRL